MDVGRIELLALLPDKVLTLVFPDTCGSIIERLRVAVCMINQASATELHSDAKNTSYIRPRSASDHVNIDSEPVVRIARGAGGLRDALSGSMRI